MKTLFATIVIVLISFSAYAADVKLSWDPSDNATGYKIYMSTDQGQSWDAGVDVGNVTTYLYPSVPDTGLVLFRVSAYNSQANVVRYNAGVWFCKDWVPPDMPTGVGVE